MKIDLKRIFILTSLIAVLGCANKEKKQIEKVIGKKHITAADILGNPDYLAISYGGYR